MVLAIVENTMEVPQKAKNKPIIPYGPTIPLLVKYPHKTTKRYMHTNIDSSIIYKSQDTEKTWCWERLKEGGEGITEDEMVGWHHQLNGHEFE